MPRLPGKVDQISKRAKLPRLPSAPASREKILRSTREAGIIAALTPAVGTKEGCRLLIYGRTRQGKSTLTERIVDALFRYEIAKTTIIHDVKYPDHAQYTGLQVDDPAKLDTALKESETVILRPPIDAAYAAELTRALVESGEPTALVVDETRRATTSAQRWCDQDGPEGAGRGPKNCEWLQLEGGGHRASTIFLVQRPSQVPGDATDSAQARIVLGMGGLSLAYVVDRRIIPAEAADTVQTLQPGEFIVVLDDFPWDRTVYYSPI